MAVTLILLCPVQHPAKYTCEDDPTIVDYFHECRIRQRTLVEHRPYALTSENQ